MGRFVYPQNQEYGDNIHWFRYEMIITLNAPVKAATINRVRTLMENQLRTGETVTSPFVFMETQTQHEINEMLRQNPELRYTATRPITEGERCFHNKNMLIGMEDLGIETIVHQLNPAYQPPAGLQIGPPRYRITKVNERQIHIKIP